MVPEQFGICLQLWDIMHDSRVVWSYRPGGADPEDICTKIDYVFQVRSKDHIRLAVTTQDDLENHDLILEEDDTFSTELLRTIYHHFRETARIVLKMDKDFVVMLDKCVISSTTGILVANLDEGWEILVDYVNLSAACLYYLCRPSILQNNEDEGFDEFSKGPFTYVQDTHILGGHIIFIFGHDDYRGRTLCILSSADLGSHIKKREKNKEYIMLSKITVETFRLHHHTAEYHSIGDLGPCIATKPFWTGKIDCKTVLILFAQADDGDPLYFMAFHLTFDPSNKSEAFRLHGTEATPYPHFVRNGRMLAPDIHTTRFRTTTLSGRTVLDVNPNSDDEFDSDDESGVNEASIDMCLEKLGFDEESEKDLYDEEFKDFDNPFDLPDKFDFIKYLKKYVLQHKKIIRSANAYCIGLDEDGSVIIPRMPHLEKLILEGYDVDLDPPAVLSYAFPRPEITYALFYLEGSSAAGRKRETDKMLIQCRF